MNITAASTEYMNTVRASMDARNVTTEDGMTMAVEGTGGGCEALVIRFPGYVVAVTDGNLGQPDGTDGDVAVLYTDTAWEDGDEGYVTMWDATPENVAARAMNLMVTGDEHDDEWTVPAPMLSDDVTRPTVQVIANGALWITGYWESEDKSGGMFVGTYADGTPARGALCKHVKGRTFRTV